MATNEGMGHPIARFVKGILDNMDTEVNLPHEFAATFGRFVPGRVEFHLPNGASWPIKVLQDGVELTFADGWAAFKSFHDIEAGYLVEFQYYGGSRFDVEIFDHTQCNIDYPLHFTCSDPSDPDRVDSPYPPSDRLLKQRTRFGLAPPSYPVEPRDVERARQEAEAFVQTIPDGVKNFMKKLVATDVNGDCMLSIPKAAATNFFKKPHNDLTIRDELNKKWPARLSVDASRARFTSGWKPVVEANKLQEGDCCVFKHIMGKEWEVIFFEA